MQLEALCRGWSHLIHICIASHFWDSGKQCRPRSDATERGNIPNIGNGLVQYIRMTQSTRKYGLIKVKYDTLTKYLLQYQERTDTRTFSDIILKIYPNKNKLHFKRHYAFTFAQRVKKKY